MSLVLASETTTTAVNNNHFLSRLWGAQDAHDMPALVHVGLDAFGSDTRFIKQLYETGILSPHSTLDGSSGATPAVARLAMPLLLSHKIVRFPIRYSTSSLHETELEWRSALLPPSYISQCGGPPVIACIGRTHCRSMAVASSLGLLVLDAARGNRDAPPRWRRFNQQEERQFRVLAMEWWEHNSNEQQNDDLLLVVVETVKYQRYLCCWSRKRLDMTHQLLEAVVEDGGSSEWGIELPVRTTPCSFSLLSSSTSPDKAVLLIADSSSDPTYICFPLQVIPLKAVTDPDAKTVAVKAAVASSGPLKFDWNDVFLASATFDFEFVNNSVQHHDGERSTSDTVAVIGIVTARSVLTVVATDNSLVEETTVLDGCVAKLYLCDVVGDIFVWMIELCDRSIWCWVTPDDSSDRAHCLYKSEGFTRPANICEHDYSYEFGTITRLGDASMWMLGSDGTTCEFTVGCVPSSNHGCLIKVGQEGTRHHRTIDGHTWHALNHEVFALGKGTMTPPTFAMSLLHNLLSTDTSPESERHFERYLRQTEEGDAVSFALRLFVVRSVEMVSEMKKNKDGRRIATDAFSRVIALLAQCLSPGIFASLLLSIARQIEPSCMSVLFPLPENVQGLRTIEDLYIESIRIGSLATPATSLPLLPKKMTSLEESKKFCTTAFLTWPVAFRKATTLNSTLPKNSDSLFGTFYGSRINSNKWTKQSSFLMTK